MTTITDLAAVTKDIYAAFGRGNVPAVLEHLAEDVRWDADWPHHYGQLHGLPLMQPRHGRAEVAEFFTVLAGYELRSFAVHDVLVGERQTVAQVSIEFAYPGGGVLRDEELHLWSFGEDGRVSSLRHYVDTAKHLAARAGEDTTGQAGTSSPTGDGAGTSTG